MHTEGLTKGTQGLQHYKILFIKRNKYRFKMTASLVERSYDCRERDLRFDSRIEQNIAGFFTVFTGSQNFELCPAYGNRLNSYHMGLITQIVKCNVHRTVA